MNNKKENTCTINFNIMKKTINLLAIMLIALSVGANAQDAGEKKKKKSKKIETMTCWASLDCESCQDKVEKNIAFEKGVKDLEVDLKSKLIKISYRPNKTSPQKLEKAIQDLGFKTEIVAEKEEKETEKEK